MIIIFQGRRVADYKKLRESKQSHTQKNDRQIHKNLQLSRIRALFKETFEAFWIGTTALESFTELFAVFSLN